MSGFFYFYSLGFCEQLRGLILLAGVTYWSQAVFWQQCAAEHGEFLFRSERPRSVSGSHTSPIQCAPHSHCVSFCVLCFIIQKEWQHWNALFKKAHPENSSCCCTLYTSLFMPLIQQLTYLSAFFFFFYEFHVGYWRHSFFLFLDIPWHYLCIPGLQHKRSVVGLLRDYMHILCQGLGWPWNKYFCSELFGVAPCEPLQLFVSRSHSIDFQFFIFFIF